MNKIVIIVLLIMLLLSSIFFLNRKVNSENKELLYEDKDISDVEIQDREDIDNVTDKEIEKVDSIKIIINNEELEVKLEQNSASEVLVEKLKEGSITINAYDYGNFEKVGELGFSLPTDDTRITTKTGDLMLYQGNQISLFYESNIWSYTKIGEVVGKAKDELKSILGNGNITYVLSID